MKMKGLLLGMLAFWGLVFVGCSDDSIEGVDNGKDNPAVNGTGYFAVSFSAGTNSSRGVTDNANGDEHEDAEDNGHHNAGVEGESAVNSILVVLNGKTATGATKEYYAYYDASDVIKANFEVANTGDYMMQKPLQVALGNYKVLVVINPTSQLLTGLTGNMTDAQATYHEPTGTSNLYQTICNAEITGDNLDAAVAKVIAKTDAQANTKANANPDAANANFMMANREEVSLEVDATHTSEHPAEALIDVERVISKITFRIGNDISDTDKTDLGDLITNNNADNWYKVPYKHYTKDQVRTTATLNGSDVEFAKYTLTEGETTTSYWKNGDKYYTISEGTAEEATTLADDQKSALKAEYAYQTDEDGNILYTTEEWFVHIESYALVNLSKELYAVRHISEYENNAYGDAHAFGQLASNDYLIDPNTAEKNDVNLSTIDWETETSTSGWFFNRWADVSADTEKTGTTAQTYFKALPGSDAKSQGTADTSHDPDDDATTDNSIKETGKLLSYCFENATDVDHQVLGLSTAIVFKAKMYAKTADGSYGAVNTPLFSYKGLAYKSLQAIVDLMGSDVVKDASNNGYLTLSDDAWTEDMVVKFETENPEISVYRAGYCYYYTSQIKHFDDGDNTKRGVMEFAIMRNNIYSLAITEIAQIGDATLNVFDPSTPDEEPTANIKVHARILPWIVRFTNINF